MSDEPCSGRCQVLIGVNLRCMNDAYLHWGGRVCVCKVHLASVYPEQNRILTRYYGLDDLDIDLRRRAEHPG